MLHSRGLKDMSRNLAQRKPGDQLTRPAHDLYTYILHGAKFAGNRVADGSTRWPGSRSGGCPKFPVFVPIELKEVHRHRLIWTMAR